MHGRGEQMRAGSRGGKDQFEWDEVKVDKHRENYLGHSLKASVGRWQKGKDLTWYTKESKVKKKTDSQDRLKTEIAAIKRAEEEAMAAALGLKPPSAKPQQTLSKQEIAEVCRRRSTDEVVEEGGEIIKGVGYQSRRTQMMYSGSKSTTTKEGATVFEHDPSLSKDDDRLTLVGSTKQLPVTSSAPPPSSDNGKQERAAPTTAVVVSEKKREKRKTHKKEKKKKQKREPCRHDSESSSDSANEWIERTSSKTHHSHHHSKHQEEQTKHKRQRHDSYTNLDSPAERWVEKELNVAPHSRRHDRRDGDGRKQDSDRKHKRRRHDTYDSD